MGKSVDLATKSRDLFHRLPKDEVAHKLIEDTPIDRTEFTKRRFFFLCEIIRT